MAQVALGDQLAFGVGREPLAAAAEQLLDLVGAHPVVLVVVEHRQQNVEVLEEVLHPEVPLESDVEVPAVPPGGKLGVERDRPRLDLVAERLEQCAGERLAAATRHDRQC